MAALLATFLHLRIKSKQASFREKHDKILRYNPNCHLQSDINKEHVYTLRQSQYVLYFFPAKGSPDIRY